MEIALERRGRKYRVIMRKSNHYRETFSCDASISVLLRLKESDINPTRGLKHNISLQHRERVHSTLNPFVSLQDANNRVR